MSSTGGLYIFAWLSLSIIGEVEGQVNSPPSNTVAEVNGEAIFNCSATPTGPYLWILSKDGTANGEIRIATSCSVSGGFENHYRTERPGGPTTCSLIVFNITMEQAGVYHCTESNAYSALLTVLDSPPVITVNNTGTAVENQSVIIECVLNHNGSMPTAPTLRPYFYWTNSNGQNVSSSYNSTTANTAVTQITVTAGRQNIMPYTCHVYLQLIPPSTPNYDNTTPTVSSSASSTDIEVLYGPSKPSSTSRPELIMINAVPCGVSVLKCSSTGNPAPSYRWYDSAENVLSTTDTLDLAEVNRKYKCEANNTIRNESTTYTVSKDNCNSTAQCCVFPRDETTRVTTEGCDNGTLCDCSQGSSGIILTCNATSFPNASYMWNEQPTDSPVYNEVTMNGTYRCTAYFDKALSNYTGNVIFPNGTGETNVGRCSATSTISIYSSSITTQNPVVSTTPKNSTGEHKPEIKPAAAFGIAIGCFLIMNILVTILFIFCHYNKVGNRNKIRLNRRFPWLQRMLPCLNDTKEGTGTNCMWVSLFILLATFTGIITFPILIALAIRFETTHETSALNRRENGDANENTANGRRPVNSPHSQSQPDNQTRAVGLHREDPYQNESRENIELNSSHHSRNLLLTNSPTSSTHPRVKPPPPPNKPTPNTPDTPGRAQNYVVPEPAAMDPNHTTYADLPFMPHVPPTRPVQYLDGTEDAYAELKKT